MSWNLKQLLLVCKANSAFIITSSLQRGPRKLGSMDFCGTSAYSSLCKVGQLEEMLHFLDLTDQRSVNAYYDFYVCLLQGCIDMKNIEEGKRVHAHIIKTGFKTDIHLENTLVNMYVKCGSVADAQKVFNRMPIRNSFSWTVMIAGYAKQGCTQEALTLFHQMDSEGIKPNEATYVSIINACTSKAALEHGKWIHTHIIKSGLESDAFVASALVAMYAKCGGMKDAHQVFDRMSQRNVCVWTMMISGYAKHGHGWKALELIQQMEREGVKPNRITYVSILKTFTSTVTLEQGKWIHAYIIKSGLESDVFLGSALISMYAKCGDIDHAHQVFGKLPKQNVISWNTMIAGYAQHGHSEKALRLFEQMQKESVKPNETTFVTILNACSTLVALEQGKLIHAHAIKSDFEANVFVGNSLLDMYYKCRSIDFARRVFDKIPNRNVVSWTLMIAGYAHEGNGMEALNLFWQMEHEGVMPNRITFIHVLNACTRLHALEQGKRIHKHLIVKGFEPDVFVGSTLVDMYAKCGSIELARQVFDRMLDRDVVSWTAIITGYFQHGHGEEAFNLFCQMQEGGVRPNKFTFGSILKACASQASLKYGEQIHAHIIKSGLEADVFVGNSLVNMYGKCRRIEFARTVFDKMPKRDVVSWNAMISVYAQYGYSEDALRLFCKMEQEDVKPNRITFINVLNACTTSGAIEQGKHIHGLIIKSGIELDVPIGNSLVDMYAKCGNIEHARHVFDKMPERDVVTWNVMIAGYAQYGYGNDAIRIVRQMQQEGVKLDYITFIGALSACGHAGLVDEGRYYFHSMVLDHGIRPTLEHYVCIVDLLGRAGDLMEVEEFIKQMPFQPNAVVWTAFLGACRIHGNLEVAKQVAECILKLEPHNVSANVLLSNSYAAAGKWEAKAMAVRMVGQEWLCD